MITLSNKSWATAAVDFMDAEYLISLLSPAAMIDTPEAIARNKHLKLGVSDIETPMDGYVCPQREHVEELLAFGMSFDGGTEVVVHCEMGRSRSAAASREKDRKHREEAEKQRNQAEITARKAVF